MRVVLLKWWLAFPPGRVLTLSPGPARELVRRGVAAEPPAGKPRKRK